MDVIFKYGFPNKRCDLSKVKNYGVALAICLESVLGLLTYMPQVRFMAMRLADAAVRIR